MRGPPHRSRRRRRSPMRRERTRRPLGTFVREHDTESSVGGLSRHSWSRELASCSSALESGLPRAAGVYTVEYRHPTWGPDTISWAPSSFGFSLQRSRSIGGSPCAARRKPNLVVPRNWVVPRGSGSHGQALHVEEARIGRAPRFTLGLFADSRSVGRDGGALFGSAVVPQLSPGRVLAGNSIA